MTDDPEITDPRDPYKRPDIVTELHRWLVSRASLREATVSHALLQRARDEIVALRKLTDGNWVWQQITSTRDEALEEAAQIIEAMLGPRHADAVRALKEKP